MTIVEKDDIVGTGERTRYINGGFAGMKQGCCDVINTVMSGTTDHCNNKRKKQNNNETSVFT